jgi:hypothetical protein
MRLQPVAADARGRTRMYREHECTDKRCRSPALQTPSDRVAKYGTIPLDLEFADWNRCIYPHLATVASAFLGHHGRLAPELRQFRSSGEDRGKTFVVILYADVGRSSLSTGCRTAVRLPGDRLRRVCLRNALFDLAKLWRHAGTPGDTGGSV